MSTELSPEENRREMRRRFDAVNEAAQNRRQLSRDSGDRKAAEENNRWSKPEPVEVEDSDTEDPNK